VRTAGLLPHSRRGRRSHEGSAAGGVTADLVLHITELLRKTKVVGKFVEFHGEGASSLPVPDRATVGNMAPEYGATIGFFDERTCEVPCSGPDEPTNKVDAFRNYYTAQKMFGIPRGMNANTALWWSSILPEWSLPSWSKSVLRIELT